MNTAQYPSGVPQAKRDNGPWGEAIRYWLNERKLRQADLVKGTKIQAKTISRITRGFHTQTRVLEVIAKCLGVSLDRVLVSPLRWGPTEDRKQLIRSIFADAVRLVEVGEDRIDDRVLEDAKRIQALPRDMRASLRAILANYEKTIRKQRHGTRSNRPAVQAHTPPLRKTQRKA
jgi:transcriptional regulator with XRE-family HTH domain